MCSHPITPANTLTKDSLTGNSGFNVSGLGLFAHITANYAAGRARRGRYAGKPMCFVEVYERDRNTGQIVFPLGGE